MKFDRSTTRSCYNHSNCKQKEMNRRSEGGTTCIAIRTTPSTSRFHHASVSSSCSDPATSGGPTWMRKSLPCVCFKKKGNYARICVNEERLRRLKNRTKVYFDPTLHEHQEALRVLWSSTFPDQELDGLISDQWKKMGWQGKDPSTDFRGAGFISLENLLFFAKTFSISFQRLIKKQGAKGAAWEYPFAVAGLNITFMLMKMLDLDSSIELSVSLTIIGSLNSVNISDKPRTLVSAVFVHMLSENEWAFDLLYCVAFVVMDKKWVDKNASYMEFNEILKSARAQLEEELLLDDVSKIEDMPSFRLLH